MRRLQDSLHFLRFKYLGNETDLVNLFALGLYHINSVNNHFTIELQISIYLKAKNCCLVAKSWRTLLQLCGPPGSSVHGISNGRILEWVAIPFSRGSSRPKDGTQVSCVGKWILYHWVTREAPKGKQYTPYFPVVNSTFQRSEVSLAPVSKFTFFTFIL